MHGKPRVLGLWFRYLHFTGSYDIRNALGYLTSVRIVRNGAGLKSIRDASKFGWSHGRPLRERRPFGGTKPAGARVFHYGFVRPPLQMADKVEHATRMYDEGTLGPARPPEELTGWQYDLSACEPYRGTHPAVMREKIAAQDWTAPPFDPVPLWRNRAFLVGRLRKAGLWPRRTGE